MSFARYLRLEGACSVGLGVGLVLVAAVWGEWKAPWVAVAVAVAGSLLAAWAARRATAGVARGARPGVATMSEAAVRRQTIAETVLWVVMVGAWVAATGSSAELIAGTGVASVAFGAVRARASVPGGLVVTRRRWLLGPVVAAPRTAPGP